MLKVLDQVPPEETVREELSRLMAARFALSTLLLGYCPLLELGRAFTPSEQVYPLLVHLTGPDDSSTTVSHTSRLL